MAIPAGQGRDIEPAVGAVERYRALVEATGALVLTGDPTGAFVEPQPVWEAFTGQGWPDQAGHGWLAMCHPDEREAARQVWEEAADGGDVLSTGGRVYHAESGDYHHLVVRGSAVRDDAGRVVEWVVTLVDIEREVVARREARVLFDAEQAARRGAERLGRLTAALSGALSYEEVTDALATEILGAVGAQNLVLVVLDENGGPPRFRSVGLRPDLAARLPEIMDDRSATGEVLRTGVANFITSRADHDRRYPARAEWWEDAGTEAAAHLPLAVGEHRLGAVRFGFDQHQCFTDDDRRFLTTVTDLAAQALQRANLHAAEQAARRAAEAAAGRAQRLGLLTAALARALTVDEVADAIAAEVQEATGGDAFTLRLLTAEGRTARVMRLGGVPPGHGERFAESPTEVPSALAELVATHRGVFVESAAQNEARYGDATGHSYEAAKIEGLARLPLLAEGKLLGVLSVGFLTPHDFRAEERLFLVTVADVAAQALQRALRTERLRQLQGLSDVALARLSLEELIADVGGRLASYLNASVVRILLYDPERRQLVSARRDPAVVEPPVPLGRGLMGRVAATRQSVSIDDASGIEVIDDVLRRSASLAAVPLMVGERLVGALAVGSEVARHFTPADLELLALAASRVAVAVDRSRAFEGERALARTLQASLLPPSLPVIPGVALAARYLAAGEGIDVGGDFYDLFSLGGGAWLAIIGDVCGRGPAAAAMTGLARHTVRAVAVEESNPAAILRRLNLALAAEAGAEDFATALCARLEPTVGGLDIVLASAGHCHPLIVRAGGTVEMVSLTGSLLGAFVEVSLEERRERLGPGDTLLFYTDGVIEAAGKADRYGEERLGRLLAGAAGLSPAEIVDRVESDVMDHCRGICDDDLALLAVGVPGHGDASGKVVAAAGEVVVDRGVRDRRARRRRRADVRLVLAGAGRAIRGARSGRTSGGTRARRPLVFWSMKEFDVSVEVNAPPEKVWSLVSNLERMGEWSPECTGVRWKGDASGAVVGNKFKGKNKHGKHKWATDCKIVAVTPNQEIAWDSAFLGFPVARWTYTLEPTPTGTKLTESWREKRNALLRWPLPGAIISGVKDRPESNKRSAEATLERIKAAAESG